MPVALVAAVVQPPGVPINSDDWTTVSCRGCGHQLVVLRNTLDSLVDRYGMQNVHVYCTRCVVDIYHNYRQIGINPSMEISEESLDYLRGQGFSDEIIYKVFERVKEMIIRGWH